MSLQHPEHGPDAMLSPDLPVSRGQSETLAVQALRLLKLDVPASRGDATHLAVRLELAIASDPEVPAVPTVEPAF